MCIYIYIYICTYSVQSQSVFHTSPHHNLSYHLFLSHSLKQRETRQRNSLNIHLRQFNYQKCFALCVCVCNRFSIAQAVNPWFCKCKDDVAKIVRGFCHSCWTTQFGWRKEDERRIPPRMQRRKRANRHTLEGEKADEAVDSKRQRVEVDRLTGSDRDGVSSVSLEPLLQIQLIVRFEIKHRTSNASVAVLCAI